MNRRVYISETVIGVLILAALAVGVMYFATSVRSSSGAHNGYADPLHRFAFELPAGSTAQNFHAADGSSETLILHGGSADVQVTITPWAGSNVLTADSLARDYPWLAEMSPRPTSVAGKVGVAFENRNEGDSNIWLASGGYLYQLVELGTRADLLRAITAHWKFD